MKTALKILASALMGANVAAAETACVGYVGASSGGRPGALRVVEVDAATGAIALRETLPLADALYIAVNKARTRLYTACTEAAFGKPGAQGGLAVYALDAAGRPTGRTPRRAVPRR